MKTLRELYNENKELFYSKSPWWINEKFADERPDDCGEITFDKKYCNMTYKGQTKAIGKDCVVPHIATVVNHLISHYKKTGERLLPTDLYVRTSTDSSDGGRVNVGGFDADGLHVFYDWDYDRYDYLGVASSRKLNLKPRTLDPVDSLTLAIETVKKAGYILFTVKDGKLIQP